MRIAVVGILIGIAIAVAFFLFDSRPAAPPAIDDQHKAAAIQVARCDAAMSSLDHELGSSHSPAAAIASRIDVCTRAKAAIERAREKMGSKQLDVAFDRVTDHLAKLNAMGVGSSTGSLAGSATSSSTGSATSSSAGSN